MGWRLCLVSFKSGTLRSRRTTDQGDLIKLLGNWKGLNNSSLETMKQSWNCRCNQDHSWFKQMIKCEKTEKNFQCYRRWRRTFYDLVDVHDCNNGISSIHGKELSEQLLLHCEHDRSLTQTNVRHIYKIGVWTRWDLRIGTIGGEIIHGNTCH